MANLVDGGFDHGLREMWQAQFRDEVLGNILPFWANHTLDHEHGGFYGGLTNDLTIHNEFPRSAVLCGRILWTFACAYRMLGDPRDLAVAEYAYAYLKQAFWDQTYGGLYWSIDANGQPLADHKQTYAQSFAIYGLAEYVRATGDQSALELAQTLFHLIEHHAFDSVYGGYIEGCDRVWQPLGDSRLSKLEPEARKTMNTMLHMMEAYANLLRVWDVADVRQQLASLIEACCEHIIDPVQGRFHLFFDDQWNHHEHGISYGHDIEGSWLLMEAAHVLGDEHLIAKAETLALGMADAVYRNGRHADGSIIHERAPDGSINLERHWWPQAEAVVGFYNAYQATGKPEFAQAAYDSWNFIQRYFIDHDHGDWFKILDAQNQPLGAIPKVGPWECPYHHARVCFEMIERLAEHNVSVQMRG
ncbi:AGE family epimerase/isomerase [Herpetosiphon gulosus]|uniref:Cellobiose 2-epimerase n=1 Tax=Herpetosiphon gulosus TaxID=1973496 RepID=A0ABP9WXY6_9CHLR